MATYKLIKPTQLQQLNGLISVSNGQNSDTLDFGLIGEYNNATTKKHSGIFRDASDGKFKFFHGLESDPFPSDIVNISDISYNQSTIVVGNIETTGVTATGTISGTSVKGGNIELNTNNIVSTDINGSISLLPDGTGEVLLKSAPISDLGAATKKYVDNVVQGLDPKESVRVGTVNGLSATGSGSGVGKILTNNGGHKPIEIDDVILSVGDRILVKNGVGLANIETITFTANENTGNYDGKYLEFETPSNSYYIWYQQSGGVDPAIVGKIGILVNLIAGETSAAIANKKDIAVNIITKDVKAESSGFIIILSNYLPGVISPAVNIDLPGPPVFSTTQTGTSFSNNDVNNGIYVVTTVGSSPTSETAGDGIDWVITRSVDADNDSEFTSGLFTFVSEGTANANKSFVVSSNDPISVDVTAITFVQFGNSSGDTTMSNLGSGSNIFKTKVGDDLQLRSLLTSSGTNVTNLLEISENADDLTFSFDQTKITETGILVAGSITTGFGDINNGLNSITGGVIQTTSSLVTLNSSELSFNGNTGTNIINIPDNQADSLSFKQGINKYLQFDTSNGSELVTIDQDLHIKKGFKIGVSTITAATAVLDTSQFLVRCDATTAASNMTLTLPPAASNEGREYKFIKIDPSAFSVTISPSLGEGLDGDTNDSLVLTSQHDHAMVLCDGNGWYVF